MKCPVCGKEMVQETFGVDVEVCESGCKGIWFDRGKLRMLLESNEGLSAALEAALRHPRNNDDKRGPIKCPKCSIPMQTHRFNRAREVNVDECYNCGGFFLDSGEITDIRDHYMSDAEVSAYTEKLISAAPQYAEGLKAMDAQEKRAESIHHLTRFMTANYWRKKFD